MRNIKQSTWETWMIISTIWLFTTIFCGIMDVSGWIMSVNVALCIGNLLFCLHVGTKADMTTIDHSDYMYIVDDVEDDCCNRD